MTPSSKRFEGITTSTRVFVPDYRLAPEHRFPAALDDVVDCYRWLTAEALPGSRTAIVGDSAGGAMVVSTMVRARNAGMPLPVGGVAISPWANLEMTGASYTNRCGRDPLNTYDVLVSMARMALGDELPNNPEASPVFADVRPRMFHVWHLLADVLAEGREALRTSAQFLERVYDGAPA